MFCFILQFCQHAKSSLVAMWRLVSRKWHCNGSFGKSKYESLQLYRETHQESDTLHKQRVLLYLKIEIQTARKTKLVMIESFKFFLTNLVFLSLSLSLSFLVRNQSSYELKVIVDILSGVHALHKLNLSHGNLKPENVLIFVRATNSPKSVIEENHKLFFVSIICSDHFWWSAFSQSCRLWLKCWSF
jgi:serine/threonine protein kinase